MRHTCLLEIDWHLISRQPRKFLLGILVCDDRNGRGGCQAVLYEKYVLTMDTFKPKKRNGIKWLNIVDFLENKE